MIDLIFGFFGLLVRLVFVYKFDLKKMDSNTSPEETHKNTMAGLLLIPIGIIIGVVIHFIEK